MKQILKFFFAVILLSFTTMVMGQVVYDQLIRKSDEASGLITINISTISPGMYQIYFKNQDSIISEKLFIIR